MRYIRKQKQINKKTRKIMFCVNIKIILKKTNCVINDKEEIEKDQF
jgi:hypothetical protein